MLIADFTVFVFSEFGLPSVKKLLEILCVKKNYKDYKIEREL